MQLRRLLGRMLLAAGFSLTPAASSIRPSKLLSCIHLPREGVKEGNYGLLY